MNAIQNVVALNRKVLAKMAPAPKPAFTPSLEDRATVEQALRQWYGQQGYDPLNSEGLVQKNLQDLYGR